MAFIAEVFRLFFAYAPGMRLMAVKARQPCLCHVEIVLPDPCFVTMAGLQAVLTGRLYLPMGMMAIKTFQRRHYPLEGEVLMAGEALLIGYHLGGFFTITVAFKAGEAFHPHAMYMLVLMTFRAGLLIRQERMQCPCMTFAAADILHEDMFGMAV